MIRKAQASLELSIAFITIMALFLGIVGIWLWGDRQIANRQPPYTHSRIGAGTPHRTPGSGGDKSLVYPVYTPEYLSEGEVHF
ncbi:MAG: hypothetical protein GF375_02010 [Candidatus Omnitrophica bacterium]|nr:hypothetical protein [Candidatus Omnitrophota bacterium]